MYFLKLGSERVKRCSVCLKMILAHHNSNESSGTSSAAAAARDNSRVDDLPLTLTVRVMTSWNVTLVSASGVRRPSRAGLFERGEGGKGLVGGWRPVSSDIAFGRPCGVGTSKDLKARGDRGCRDWERALAAGEPGRTGRGLLGGGPRVSDFFKDLLVSFLRRSVNSESLADFCERKKDKFMSFQTRRRKKSSWKNGREGGSKRFLSVHTCDVLIDLTTKGTLSCPPRRAFPTSLPRPFISRGRPPGDERALERGWSFPWVFQYLQIIFKHAFPIYAMRFLGDFPFVHLCSIREANESTNGTLKVALRTVKVPRKVEEAGGQAGPAGMGAFRNRLLTADVFSSCLVISMDFGG